MGLRADWSGAARTPRVAAAIDIGSNSTHLVVSAVGSDGQFATLADESTFASLGDLVARDGRFGEVQRGTLLDTLSDYVAEARRLGAGAITIVGTEPVRMATDRAELADAIVTATDVPLEVLTHEDEAYLMVVGVQAGRRVTGELLVVDIGGGSTEFCLVGPTRIPYAVGLKLGSSVLTARHATSDPPKRDDVEAMIRDAAAALATAPDFGPTTTMVAVGGTVSNLVKLVPAALRDRRLTRASIADARVLLEAMTAEAAVTRYLFKPARARLLPAGAAVVEALLDRYGADGIDVSDAGLREGVILAVAQAGETWRAHLPELAKGWRD